TLLSEVNYRGAMYYRHPKGAGEGCTRNGKRMMVRADDLDEAVFRRLFELFGNPEGVRRAVEAAVPDREKVNAHLERLRQADEELEKIGRARNAVLDRIERELITDEQADAKLRDLKQREDKLREELDELATLLADVPDVDEAEVAVKRFFGVQK